MKQGTNLTLPVEFGKIDFDKIESIEFIFKQENSKKAPALKTALWINGDENETAYRAHDGSGTIYIPWKRDETYAFRDECQFYLDCRIHIFDSNDNPFVPVMPIKMTRTLFDEGEEVK